MSQGEELNALQEEMKEFKSQINKDLDNYFNTMKCHTTATLGTQITFPPNKGCGFTKDNITHIHHLHECFKTLKVALCINIATMCKIPTMAPEFLNSNTTILMAMHGLLEAQQDLWYTRKHSKDTFHTLQVLETMEMQPTQHQCLLNTIAMTSMKHKCAARSGQSGHLCNSQNNNSGHGCSGHNNHRGKSSNTNPYKPVKVHGQGSPATETN
jgi:hypothetical protein